MWNVFWIFLLTFEKFGDWVFTHMVVFKFKKFWKHWIFRFLNVFAQYDRGQNPQFLKFSAQYVRGGFLVRGGFFGLGGGVCVLLTLWYLTSRFWLFLVRFTLYIAILSKFRQKKTSFFMTGISSKHWKRGKKGKKGYVMYFSWKYIVWALPTQNFMAVA